MMCCKQQDIFHCFIRDKQGKIPEKFLPEKIAKWHEGLSPRQHQLLVFSSSSAVSERLISLSSHPITAQSARYYFSLGGRIRPHKSAKREERQSYNHAVLFYCRTATNTEFLNKASGPHLTRSAGVSQRYHSHLCSMITESQNLYSVNNNAKSRTCAEYNLHP